MPVHEEDDPPHNYLRDATQKDLQRWVGKRSNEFPRPAKPRDSAVNWQSTASDITGVEIFHLPEFSSIPFAMLFLIGILKLRR